MKNDQKPSPAVSMSLLAVLSTLALIVVLPMFLTERSELLRLRAEVAAMNSVPDPVELPVHVETPPPDIPPAPATIPTVNQSASLAKPDNELARFRQENEQLKARLSKLQDQQIAGSRAETLAKSLEAAYVGPGTWVSPDATANLMNLANSTERPYQEISKLTISGSLKRVPKNPKAQQPFIRVWSVCETATCDWGQVPLFMVDYEVNSFTFRRGFATWNFDGVTTHLAVTFHESGLKVDRFDFTNADQKSLVSWATDTMTKSE